MHAFARPPLDPIHPLERFDKEVGRRSDVVGIFPNDAALIRLAGMLCIEQNDAAGRPRLPLGRIDLSRPDRAR